MSGPSESEPGTTHAGRLEEAPRVRPFPWRSLEATTGAEISELRGIRRWFAARANAEAILAAAQDLLGARVDVRVRRAQPLSAATPLDGSVAVHVAPAVDAPSVTSASQAGALFEAERSLAARVVAGAIRRPPARVIDPSSEASASLAGALAAVIVAIARRAGGGDAFRALAAGPAGSLEADLRHTVGDDTALSGPDPWRALTFAVRVDDDLYAARLVVWHEQALLAPDPPWTREVLSRLGPTPLSIPIVACQTWSTVAECAELRTGDVLLPEAWPLGRGKNGRMIGPVLLAAPGSDAVGVRAVLNDEGDLVLSGEVEPLSAAEARMAESDESEGGALITAIGDVPVVVRVEIGEARMAARDWASLGRGDVVTLGRRVGEQVVLRVGGIPVARGQLVEVDGHVGVRIDERITEERTTA